MSRVDPFKNFRFLVEIDGIAQAGFSECSGFGSNIEVIEYREGGDPTTVRKLPGKTSYTDIVLKWGMTSSREIYDWHLQAINGQLSRRNGSVIILDDLGQEAGRYNFFSAWPSKYDPVDLNAKGNDVALDTLTISCERLERA